MVITVTFIGFANEFIILQRVTELYLFRAGIGTVENANRRNVLLEL